MLKRSVSAPKQQKVILKAINSSKNQITQEDQSSQNLCTCDCSMCKDEIKRLNAVISKLKDEMINLKKHLSMLEWNDKYKEIGIQKRQQVMETLGQKLQSQNFQSQSLEKKINKLEEQLGEQHDFTKQLMEGVEFNLMNQQQNIRFQMSSRLTRRRLQSVIGAENTQRFLHQSMNAIQNQKFEQQINNKTQKNDTSIGDNDGLEQLIKKSQKDLPPKNRVIKKKRSQIVSEMNQISDQQGSHREQSFFSDSVGNFSFFHIDPKQQQNVIEKLNFLETFFIDDSFSIKLDKLNPIQQREIGKYIRFLIKDLRHFINIGWRLKQLLLITTEMIRKTNLQDAYLTIKKHTCQYLNCDRVSIFILDKEKQILWTKQATSGQMIQIQMDKGIVGFCVLNNVKVNVEDAYQDERFNKNIDMQTGYRTKTILVVPILDESGNVMGALEAINKTVGFFNRDDEDLLEIIATFTGGIVKNSLLFEDAVLKLSRSKKLMHLATQLYQFSSIKEVIKFSENQICSMMRVQRCKIYKVQRKDFKFFVEIKDKQQEVNENNSLIGNTLFDREVIYVRQPGSYSKYNPQIDIDTHLPLITLPLVDKDEAIQAVIQVEAMMSIVTEMLGNQKDEDIQLLQLFGETLGRFLGYRNL